MLKEIAYRQREARAKEEARKVREEAHWGRTYRIARGTLICVVLTLVLTLSNNEKVKWGVRYAANVDWSAIVASKDGDQPGKQAVATKTARSDVTQHRAEVAETTSKPNPDQVLQFASHPVPDTGAAAYSAPPSGLSGTGLPHRLGESYLNPSLTSSSVIDRTSALHVASATLPNTSLTSSSMIGSTGLLHALGESYLNPSLTSSPVIDSSSSLHLAGATPPNTILTASSMIDSGLIHAHGESYLNPSLTSSSVIDSTSALHLASATFANPSFTSSSMIDGTGRLHRLGESYLNPSLTSSSVIDSTSALHLASATFANTSLTSSSTIDSTGLLHPLGETLLNPSLTSPSVLLDSGLLRQPSTDLMSRH
jgi:hypothetical protein